MEEELNAFRHRLEECMPGLSKSHQQIATYLLSHYDEAAFLSAADLATNLNVSEATVVRFAKASGYTGYPQLRRSLQSLYRSQVTPAARLRHKLTELSASQGHVLTKVLDMEVQYLTEAEHAIAPADFDRAVEILLQGRRVFCLRRRPVGDPGRAHGAALAPLRHLCARHDRIRPQSD